MRYRLSLLLTLLLAAGVASAGPGATQPPVARKVPKSLTLHGVTLVDDYNWLREKEAPEVTAYLEAENAYTEAGLKHTAALQETLYKEMLGRIKESDQQVPAREGDYWYYTRTEQGKSYPIFCRRKGSPEAPEEIYLDQNALAEGKKFHALGGLDVSPDGTKLIYLEDLTAFREYTLYVKDLTTGKILESIPKVWNGNAWANDNKTFFYMTPDAAKRGDTVWRHVMGTPSAQDVKVLTEPNVLFNVTVAPRVERRVHRHRRQQLHLVGVASDSDEPPDRRAARHRRAPARRRVQRRARRRLLLHGDQRRRAQLQDLRAADRSGAARVDATGRRIVTTCSSKAGRLREVRRGHRAAAGTAAPARRGPGHRPVPRHHVSGDRVRRLPWRQPRVQDRHLSFQLLVAGHAVVDLRLRPGDAGADAEETAGDPQRLRPGQVRGAPCDGAGARRRRGAGLDPDAQGHAARRVEPAAAVRVRILRLHDGADVRLRTC